MIVKLKYEFTANVWQHSGVGGWFFVSLSKEISQEIRSQLKWQEEGWGRLKAIAQIGNTNWETAIWYDTKSDSYLLPLKAAIRKIESLVINQEIDVIVWL